MTEYEPLNIEVYSHFFLLRLENQTPKNHINKLISSFAKRLFEYNYIQGKGQFLKAIYAARTADGIEKRFHINLLDDFLGYISTAGFPKEHVLLKRIALPTDLPQVEYHLKESFILRPNQVKAIEFCLGYGEDDRVKLVELKTGEGKSLVSMKVASELKSRFFMICRSQYLEKWRDDLMKSTDIEENEILIVRGNPQLVKVLQLGILNDLNQYKAILLSNSTFRSYITNYEKIGRQQALSSVDFPISPEQICATIGARVLLIDEGHQDFHFNFKLTLYTHTELLLTTTATLHFSNEFLEDMVSIAYPPKSRFNPHTQQNYIHIRPLLYKFCSTAGLNYTRDGSYSHIMLEKTLMRKKYPTQAYYNMVYSIIEDIFLPTKQKYPHFKAIVFCGTVKMCTELSSYIKGRLPSLDVRRYTGEDPYENLVNSDIIVTTPSSAGTAVDIKGLYLAINTVSLVSPAANLQILGRLRMMPEKTNPYYFYLVCADIKSHIHAHRQKRSLFKDKTLSYEEIAYQTLI